MPENVHDLQAKRDQRHATDGTTLLACPACGGTWLEVASAFERTPDGLVPAGRLTFGVCVDPYCRTRVDIDTPPPEAVGSS